MPIINVNNSPTPIVSAGDGSTLIYNRDLLNSVIYGTGSGISGGLASNTNQYDIIDPLGCVVVDGKDDIWASTLTAGTSVALSVKQGVSYQSASPSQIAASIAATGTFAINNSTVLQNTSTTQNIGAGGTITVVNGLKFAQSAYEIGVQVQATAGETSPEVCMDVKWTDSATGQVAGHERWWLGCSSTAPGQKYLFFGPTKGDTVTVTIGGSTNTGIISVTSFMMVVNSRVWGRDYGQQETYSALPGFTQASADMQNSILCATSPSIGTSSSAGRIMSLWAGMAQVSFIPAGAATGGGHVNVSVIYGTPDGLSATTIFESQSKGTNKINQPVALPRGLCSITLFNDDTTNSGIFSAVVTAQEQPQ